MAFNELVGMCRVIVYIMVLCIGIVGYDTTVSTTESCADYYEIDGRNNCTIDKECFEIGRKVCDVVSNCFGIVWHEHAGIEDAGMRICTSNVMETQTNSWRTVMKLGMYVVFFVISVSDISISLYVLLHLVPCNVGGYPGDGTKQGTCKNATEVCNVDGSCIGS